MNKNIPKLRFIQFNDEWEMKKLGEVFTFRPTNSFSRENLNYNGGKVKNIHYGDIHTKFKTLFNIKLELVPFINEEINIDRISSDNYCKVGDLILADASEDLNDVGKSIEICDLNNEKLLAGLHTILARPNKNTFKIGFTGLLFKSSNVRLNIQKESQGSKVLSISPIRLSKIPISFPTLPEQEKIADFLRVVDEKLEKMKEKRQYWEQYKKGIMQKIFSQEIRFKDYNGNNYPDWQEKRLGEIGEFYSGGTPYSTNREFYGGKIPFIRSGEINKKNTELYLTEDGLKNSSAKMVNSGDILIALYGATSGEVGISKINGAINQAILCIKTKEHNYFIFSLLKYNKENIINTYLQGGQGNLSKEIIKSLVYELPSYEEQTKIADFLSSIDDKIEQINSEISELSNWKKGLLQQMFV